mgnify:CR=1 FL=1
MEKEKQNQELIILLLFVLLFVTVGFLFLRNSFLSGEISKVEKRSEEALARISDNSVIEPVDKLSDPFRGNEQAENKFYVYSSFSCSHCSSYSLEIKKLLEKNGDKVKVIWKDAVSNDDFIGEKAALAARCAQQQGKFWEYHDLLFANQNKLTDQDLIDHAKTIGLNEIDFKSCVSLKKTATIIQASQNEAVAVGVDGTPYTVVNGQRLSGVYLYEQLKELLK